MIMFFCMGLGVVNIKKKKKLRDDETKVGGQEKNAGVVCGPKTKEARKVEA